MAFWKSALAKTRSELRVALAAGLLAVGMEGSAWAGMIPTQPSYISYSFALSSAPGQQSYNVTGTVGVLPGLYGDGDYKCYVSGTAQDYPGIEPNDLITLAFTSKNATTGQCPDYAKFGTLTIYLNYPNLGGEPDTEDWTLAGTPPVPNGKMFWVTLNATNGVNTYIAGAAPGLPLDFQAFALLPSSINLLQLYGSAQVYLATGLANTIGF